MQKTPFASLSDASAVQALAETRRRHLPPRAFLHAGAALPALAGGKRTLLRQRIHQQEVIMPAFCPVCGAPVTENGRHLCRSTGSTLRGSGRAALAPNIAGALAYAGGLITGIVFLVLEPYRRERYVRFHAWQSIGFSLAWIALWIPWTMVASVLVGTGAEAAGRAAGGDFAFATLLIAAMNRLLWLAGFLFWAFLLFKAYGGEQFQIPVIGKLAAGQAARPVG